MDVGSPAARARMRRLLARLRAALEPDEAIVFGAPGGGPAPAGGAGVLLILGRGCPRGRERRARLRGALGTDAEAAGHVLAFTVEELQERLSRGSTLVRDALARGRAVYPPGTGRSRHADLARQWSRTGAAADLLDRARDDLDAAEALLAAIPDRRRQWWAVAFHAQQAAEKALKALCFQWGEGNSEPPHTHELEDLAGAAAGLRPHEGHALLDRFTEQLAALSWYAVEPRYDDGAPIGADEAAEAVGHARLVTTQVAGILRPAVAAGPPAG